MSARLRISWPFALLTVAACAAFVSLGNWQWSRGVHREAVWRDFALGADEPTAVTGGSLASGLPRYTRVRVEGTYDASRQVLLDNQSRQGRPGYELLTPLRLADGSLLLVNRGWLPFSGYRDRLPDVSIPEPPGNVVLTGRLDGLPTAGLASGRAPPPLEGPWPRVTTFPTAAELAGILGEPLHEPVLLLDADSGPGFLRDWQPPGVSPDRNFSYAVQWWAFAALALVLFVVLTLKRSR